LFSLAYFAEPLKTNASIWFNKMCKANNFIQENNIKQLNKDLTDTYQKQIQQTLQKCNALMDKRSHRYLENIKPTAPKLNIYIKTNKDNEPIRPVVNNTLAPSYKIAKLINKKLNSLLCLSYTYNTKKTHNKSQMN